MARRLVFLGVVAVMLSLNLCEVAAATSQSRADRLQVQVASIQVRVEQSKTAMLTASFSLAATAAMRHATGFATVDTGLMRRLQEGVRRSQDNLLRRRALLEDKLSRYQRVAAFANQWTDFIEKRQLDLFGQPPTTVTGSGVPGPFAVCPVDPPRTVADDFGAPRYAGGYHQHAGNDILAPRGTPIRAPFDGVATDSTNGLGGRAVRVTGALGYVYNAHLDSIGTLGAVHAGDVVGYVGNSGDAAGGPTHDHFEWHPSDVADGTELINGAIDPHPALIAACAG
jgi:murein DD-endopeptidase MepM/ murein hydrolase activator NlpD